MHRLTATWSCLAGYQPVCRTKEAQEGHEAVATIVTNGRWHWHCEEVMVVSWATSNLRTGQQHSSEGRLVHACTYMTRVCPSTESPSARKVHPWPSNSSFFLSTSTTLILCGVAAACKAALLSCCICSTSTALPKIVTTRESNSFSPSFFGRVD